MNQQPYGVPPQRWESQLSPFWVRMLRPWRNRTLYREQRILQVDVEGVETVQRLLGEGAGVLITPNHSFHFDSYVLFEAAHRVGRHVHVMTAWQVFAMSTRFERWTLQKHGCFSIDREGADLHAFKQSVELLRTDPHPLVIFPEGDIYHLNERVTPFREGAAAIALSAAKRAERPIYCLPTAIQAVYRDDPVAELVQAMTRLEERFRLRPRPHQPLADRVLRFAEALLTLKEIDYLGQPQPGALPARLQNLAWQVLGKIEQRAGVTPKSDFIPERVKELRKQLIAALQSPELTPDRRAEVHHEMDDLFFVIQLFSYPGDYLTEKPSIERLAETIDKFEEDVLEVPYPAIRGTRSARVRFGEPILVPKQPAGKDAAGQLTLQLEQSVQRLLSAPAA